MTPNRRSFLLMGTGLAMVLAAPMLTRGGRDESRAAEGIGSFEITRTKAEWRSLLTEAQYKVLREEATERPYSSPLNDEKRAGIFHCAGCDLPVYDSKTKFDSGTGWPSFYEALPDAVGTKQDNSLFLVRTEVHCRRCGGHFGHIFDDGPEPTGKRHCINGLALTFVAA